MQNDDNKKKTTYPTSMMLFIRVFIGGYLLYLTYQLISATDTSMSKEMIMAFCALFTIAGIAMIALSVKMLIKGEYQGGKADPDIEDSNIEAPDIEDIDDEKEQELEQ